MWLNFDRPSPVTFKLREFCLPSIEILGSNVSTVGQNSYKIYFYNEGPYNFFLAWYYVGGWYITAMHCGIINISCGILNRYLHFYGEIIGSLQSSRHVLVMFLDHKFYTKFKKCVLLCKIQVHGTEKIWIIRCFSAQCNAFYSTRREMYAKFYSSCAQQYTSNWS